MAMWLATAIDEGFNAYMAGTPRCLNPYMPKTEDVLKWFEGWDTAQRKIGVQ